MSELSNESKALLEREAHLDEATPAELEAMRLRVVAALGAAALPSIPAGHEAGSGSLAQAAVTGVSLKVAGSALLAAVGTSVLLLSLSDPAGKPGAPVQRAHSATAAPAPLPTPPAPAVLAPSASASVAEDVSAPKPRKQQVLDAPRAPASQRPATPASGASEEALLVAAAEAQLRSGHPSAALALYEQHLRDYPKGALRHESWVGRIVALCDLGRAAETRAEVARLAERNPDSATLQRIRRACGDER